MDLKQFILLGILGLIALQAQAQLQKPRDKWDTIFSAFQNKQYKQALNQIDTLLRFNQKHPQLPMIYMVQANCYLELSQLTKAHKAITKFIENFPDHPSSGNAYYLLAKINRMELKYHQAYNCYARAWYADIGDELLKNRILTDIDTLLRQCQPIEFDFQPGDSIPLPFQVLTSYYIALEELKQSRYENAFTRFQAIREFDSASKLILPIDSLSSICHSFLNARFRIAIIGPLTEDKLSYGKELLYGTHLACHYIADKDSLFVRPLYWDNENDPIVTVQKIKLILKTPDISGIIGPVRSVNTLAASIVAGDDSIPLLTPTVVIDNLPDLGPSLFQLRVPTTQQGRSIAEYAIQHLRHNQFVVLAPNSVFGHRISQAFIDMAEKLGARLIDTLWFNSNIQDVEILLKKLKSKINNDSLLVMFKDSILIKNAYSPYYKIPAFFIPLETVDQALEILPELNSQLIQTTVLGNTVYLDQQLLQNHVWDMNEIIIASDDLSFNNKKSPLQIYFENEYSQQFNQIPDIVAKKSFDAALLLLEAIRQSATTPQAILNFLHQQSNFEGTSGHYNFYSESQSNKYLHFYRLKNRQIDILN